MKFRVRYADRVVGMFIFLALALVAALLVFVAVNQRWFSHNAFFKSRLNSTNGLAVGSSLTMRGFELGKISDMSLTADNKVQIEFYVYEKYRDKVTKNSVIELVSSPVGLGTSLLFHRGFSTVPLAEGSLVPSMDMPEGLALERAGLVDRPRKDDSIASLLASINEMSVLINDTLKGRGSGPINDILLDVARTTDGLPAAAQRLKDGLPAMADDLQRSLAQIAALTDNLQALSAQIRDPKGLVPTLLDDDKLPEQIDRTMAGLNQSMDNVNKITAGLSGEVPKLSSLIQELRQAIVSAQDVMEGLKNNPLLKDGITKKPTQQAVFESLRREDF